jgi:hydrogenase-4 component B
MTPIQGYAAVILLLLLGAFVSLFIGRQQRLAGYFCFGLVLVSTVVLGWVVLQVYVHGPLEARESFFWVMGLSEFKGEVLCMSCHSSSRALFSVPGFGASLILRIDHLSGFFLLIIVGVGLLSSLFSIRYMEQYRRESLVGFYPPLLVFLASMIAVAGMADLFFFFLFWEVMTLASYALVVFERERQESLRAGFKYFLMTHAATACMFLAGIMLYVRGGSFSFDVLRSTLGQLVHENPGLAHLILALFFLGFATKAGVFPFGDWLPDAHPAAPSGISALLSGVMIKMGVYGMLRVFLLILPSSYLTTTWGGIIAFFGTLSLFVGSLTALYQGDSKRLLAFHSMGQIGYVLLAIGMGIAFRRVNPAISAVALIAGLFHLLNHAQFKSLLFLNAGSLLYVAGTRNLNALGGLLRRMPWTAVTALVGGLALAGIPPLNGFASKWLIYQVTILGGLDRPVYVLYALLAFFGSAVTLASVLKFITAAFLGHPSLQARETVDVPWSMRIAQCCLGALCVLMGLFPVPVLRLLYQAISPGLAFPAYEALFGGSPWGVTSNLGEGLAAAWNPLVMVAALLACLALSVLIYRVGAAPVRQTALWYCGEAHRPQEVKFSAHSLYLPFKHLFSLRVGSYEQEGVYPVLPIPRLKLRVDLARAFDVDRYLFRPAVRWAMGFMERFSRLHVGIPQVYVAWMVIGVLMAILILFAFSRV